ncbi:MAG TPA: hypothetical protein VH142_14630 [Polyangiaceae bacterium]|nr:hypothetical protein [Polyangiaceae bacterium]
MRRLSSVFLCCFACSCSNSTARPGASFVEDAPRQALAAGRFVDALRLCGGAEADAGPGADAATSMVGSAPDAGSCDAQWCRLIARTMLWVDDFNQYLLPVYGNQDPSTFQVDDAILPKLVDISNEMDVISASVDPILDAKCEYDAPHVPFLFGDSADPVVLSDIRGTWTPAAAAFIGASVDSLRYLFQVTLGPVPVQPAPPGQTAPLLPVLMQSVHDRIAAMDAWVHAHPTTPDELKGGWNDANGDGRMDEGDHLLIDLFNPGTDQRTFDYSGVTPVDHESLPVGAFTPTAQLPASKCGYQKFHIDTLFDTNVGTTDGMSFSPDGTKIAFPEQVNGTYEVQIANLDGSSPTCITCNQPVSWNDGVRWRPKHPDTLLFISTRDHPHSTGGAGGGFGQELYAMRTDGSQQTRLTTSGAWATNYHANFSSDGDRVVWTTTQGHTWDVTVADFVDDASGFHLANEKRLTHDTTWWETHDFSLDGTKVLTTNTRAGWQSADLYTVDIATGALTRLTDDPSWDEHAHLSPDGRKISWISGRWRPASALRLTDGSLDATYDFYWIGPAILLNFVNPPAGFSTELTLMDADGSNVTRLTTDDQVCADNQWSPDATKILFRQTPQSGGNARLRLLSFDDCN